MPVLPKSQDPATVSARTPSQRGKTLLNHNCATGRRSSRSCRVRCGPIFSARAFVQRATAESAAVITNVTETYTCFDQAFRPEGEWTVCQTAYTGVLCLLLLLVWPASSAAQPGRVGGRVVDQTGLALPGATVTVRGAGGPRTVASDERGDFELDGIAPGPYTLTVSLPGFSDATVDGVVVPAGGLALPPVVLQLARFGDAVVVTASRNEVRLIDAPVSTSVISTATLATTPALNYGDLLRATPGVNVIQLSARDVQVTSRSPGNTLANSQLVLVDGRSAYLDFFGLVLWDLLPTNFADVEQIEVVRGPASAVWGANAMTGAVNIITKPPRESVGTTVTLSGGYVDRHDGSGVGLGAGSIFGANATVTRAPSDRLSYRVSAGYFTSAAFARPTGRIPVIDDPRQPGQTVGGAFYPLDSGTAAFGTGFANRGTSQPKFDVRVDHELSDAPSPTRGAWPARTASSTAASARSTYRRGPL